MRIRHKVATFLFVKIHLVLLIQPSKGVPNKWLWIWPNATDLCLEHLWKFNYLVWKWMSSSKQWSKRQI